MPILSRRSSARPRGCWPRYRAWILVRAEWSVGPPRRTEQPPLTRRQEAPSRQRSGSRARTCHPRPDRRPRAARGARTSAQGARLASRTAAATQRVQTSAGGLRRWVEAQLQALPESEDRARLRSYASWKLLRDVARRAENNDLNANAAGSARARLRSAIELTAWMHEQDRTLRRTTRTPASTVFVLLPLLRCCARHPARVRVPPPASEKFLLIGTIGRQGRCLGAFWGDRCGHLGARRPFSRQVAALLALAAPGIIGSDPGVVHRPHGPRRPLAPRRACFR